MPAGSSVDEEPLVDLEEPALALELMLELVLLAAQPLDVVGVDERLGGRRREDRQRDLVVLVEAVRPERRHDDDALRSILADHRDDQHRFGAIAIAQQHDAWIGRGVAETDGATVLRDPAGESLRRSSSAASPCPARWCPGTCPRTRSARTCAVAWSTR